MTKYILTQREEDSEAGVNASHSPRTRSQNVFFSLPGNLQTLQGALKLLLATFLAGALALMMGRVLLLWTLMPLPILAAITSPSRAPPRLSFEKDGSFKITVFNDLHFGEGEDNPAEWGWGPISDQKSLKVMNTILDEEESQLVVLNGDLITGENTYFHNSTKYLDMIVEPLVRRSKPWASSYGNHDQQFNLSTHKLLQKEMEYPDLSLTRDMIHVPEAGTSNYWLPVYGSKADQAPALLLWFFDSRGGSVYQKSTPKGGRVGIEGVVHNVVSQYYRCKLQANGTRQRNGFSRLKRGLNQDSGMPYQAWLSFIYQFTQWQLFSRQVSIRIASRGSTMIIPLLLKESGTTIIPAPMFPLWQLFSRPKVSWPSSVDTIMVMIGVHSGIESIQI